MVLIYQVEKNENMTKALSFATNRGFFTWLLSHRWRMAHIYGFLDYFNFGQFYITSCCFVNERPSSLKSRPNF